MFAAFPSSEELAIAKLPLVHSIPFNLKPGVMIPSVETTCESAQTNTPPMEYIPIATVTAFLLTESRFCLSSKKPLRG
jgi:hypothetical protein